LPRENPTPTALLNRVKFTDLLLHADVTVALPRLMSVWCIHLGPRANLRVAVLQSVGHRVKLNFGATMQAPSLTDCGARIILHGNSRLDAPALAQLAAYPIARGSAARRCRRSPRLTRCAPHVLVEYQRNLTLRGGVGNHAVRSGVRRN
jgi:hypothetical protein